MENRINTIISKQQQVDEILRPFILSDELIKQITQIFQEEMSLGLSKEPYRKSSLQMENTYIPELCNGTEKGEFLALDLGGTNFRVILLKLQPDQEVKELVQYYAVPEQLRIGKGEPLFDFLAACIYDFLKQNNLLHQKFQLGFCFSFPMVQVALNVGILVTWTKSFNCPDVIGKDAVEMLTAAIKKRGDIMVNISAVVNDTTGTIMKGAYVDHRCAIGLVLGTGCNACYLEKVSRIEKWVGDHPGVNEVVIDTEWGAFGDNGVLDFITTEYDRQVDDESLLKHSFTFEKKFAGKFIGDVCRHVIRKLIAVKVLFNGKCPEDLQTQNSLTAADVSRIVSDEGDLLITKQVFEKFDVKDLSIADAYIIKQVCCIISARGALLVSICLASLLNRMEKEFVTIAIDGSLYKGHPYFHDLMIEYISELAPGRQFSLVLAEDGSGKGAGLVAAVVDRLDTSLLHA